MKLARRCKTAPLAAALMLVFAGAAMADQSAASAAPEQKPAGAQPVGEAQSAAVQQAGTARDAKAATSGTPAASAAAGAAAEGSGAPEAGSKARSATSEAGAGAKGADTPAASNRAEDGAASGAGTAAEGSIKPEGGAGSPAGEKGGAGDKGGTADKGSAADKGGAGAEGNTTATGNAAPTGGAATGTAPGEPGTQADKTGQAQKAEAGLKVGFVLPTAPDASGWSQSHQKGIETLREKLGDQVNVTVLDNVKDVDAEKAFRELADAGNRIIFGTGPSYEALMKRLALEYPDVRWEVAGLNTSAGNIRAYGARAYEAVYLAGVAAGKMTKTDLIGFVAPVPIPEVVRNIDAFALGAQSVNPTARVKVAWINGWVDPVRETEATQTLINSGADVLISNTASDDPLKQAERVGKFAFGWASDRSEAAPKAHLGSVAFDWGDYYVQTVKQVVAKRWKATPSWQGVKDGRVDLVALSDRLTPDARAAVEEKREALRKGTLQIWKGPLVTVDDRELLPVGKVGDDRFLEGLMTYVKGVDGQVPAGR